MNLIKEIMQEERLFNKQDRAILSSEENDVDEEIDNKEKQKGGFKRDFKKRIRSLVAYFKEFGTISNIKQEDVYEFEGEKVKIGWLISNLRQDRKKGLLLEDEIKLLDYMGMDWRDVFGKNLQILKLWCKETGKTLKDATNYTKFEYQGEVMDVGAILTQLRKGKKKNKLTQPQIDILEIMGIVWAPRKLETNYEALIAYAEEMGSLADIEIDKTYEFNGENYLIGRQVNYLRTKYNKGLLDDETIKFFENLGMVWDVKEYKNRNLDKTIVNNFDNILPL